MNAIDILIEKIKKMNNPTVLGLDPRYEMVPKFIRDKYLSDTEGICKAIEEFNKKLIDAVYDIIPAIKPQLAFYEMLGIEGMKLFKETCKYAKQKDMIVIADAKRGDIGSTATAYAEAYLKNNFYDIDFLTVNPYLGIDGIKPFIDICKENNKGIFILVKTSNPSSGELQDLKVQDGDDIYIKVAKLVETWGEDLRGENGYSSIAAVVGATYPKQLEQIRNIAPHTYFLIPGYGVQGGKAKDIALGFDESGLGGIVNSSRGLMCAYKSDKWKDKFGEESFEKATRAEAIRMRDELNNVIKEEK